MHARRAILPTLLLTAWGFVHCGQGAPGARPLIENPMPRLHQPLTVADAPATIDELRDRIANVLAREGVPGAGIALVGRDGPIWVAGIGVRDRESRAPMDGDTLSFLRGVIGIVHPLTIAVCGFTILFAVASAASLVAAIRWSLRPDRPRLLPRLFPTACAIAFSGLALWFAAHGMIGFRSWAW